MGHSQRGRTQGTILQGAVFDSYADPFSAAHMTHCKHLLATMRVVAEKACRGGGGVLKYAVTMLEQLSNVLIEPIGPEGRLRVLNSLLRERGVEEMPYIFPQTGKPTIAAEEYHRCLNILIEHARQTMEKSDVSMPE